MATVLVVDDDVQVRMMLAEMLEHAGYRVLAVSDGDDGLEQYRRQQIDVVITDLLMPGVDGLETIMNLRQIDPTVKIIAISGGGVKKLDCLTSASMLGAQYTFHKPVQRDELLSAVESLVSGNMQEQA